MSLSLLAALSLSVRVTKPSLKTQIEGVESEKSNSGCHANAFPSSWQRSFSDRRRSGKCEKRAGCVRWRQAALFLASSVVLSGASVIIGPRTHADAGKELCEGASLLPKSEACGYCSPASVFIAGIFQLKNSVDAFRAAAGGSGPHCQPVNERALCPLILKVAHPLDYFSFSFFLSLFSGSGHC